MKAPRKPEIILATSPTNSPQSTSVFLLCDKYFSSTICSRYFFGYHKEETNILCEKSQKTFPLVARLLFKTEIPEDRTFFVAIEEFEFEFLEKSLFSHSCHYKRIIRNISSA